LIRKHSHFGMINVCPSETGLMSRKAKLRSQHNVLTAESRIIAIPIAILYLPAFGFEDLDAGDATFIDRSLSELATLSYLLDEADK
jgi:hypothetical protein